MHNSAKGNLSLDILDGTFTATDNRAKIVEHLNTAANYLIKYGVLTTLGANLSDCANGGLDAPTVNMVVDVIQ